MSSNKTSALTVWFIIALVCSWIPIVNAIVWLLFIVLLFSPNENFNPKNQKTNHYTSAAAQKRATDRAIERSNQTLNPTPKPVTPTPVSVPSFGLKEGDKIRVQFGWNKARDHKAQTLALRFNYVAPDQFEVRLLEKPEWAQKDQHTSENWLVELPNGLQAIAYINRESAGNGFYVASWEMSTKRGASRYFRSTDRIEALLKSHPDASLQELAEAGVQLRQILKMSLPGDKLEKKS